MKKQELQRRISILENHTVPEITRMQLRGGMQDRLHRQELIRYGRDIKSKKTKFKDKLSSLASDKEKKVKLKNKISAFMQQEKEDVFGVSSSSIGEERQNMQRELSELNRSIDMPLEDFHEPMMRRFRSRRGFH